MNAVQNEAYRMDSPWWQLAENLCGRISRHICLVDDRGELARELEERGVDVERVDYRMLRCPVAEGTLESAMMELEPRKLKELLARCDTELVMVVEEPERTVQAERDGVTVRAVRRRSVLTMLDMLNVGYSYKTILSGDVGCFVVEGLA